MADTDSSPLIGQVADTVENNEAKTSLADEMRAAFKAAESEPDAEESIKAKPESKPEKGDTEVTEKADEEKPSESEEEKVEEEDSPEGQADKELPLIPNNWSKEEKEAFQVLLDSDDEDKRMAAEILIERHNSMKKTFFKKTEELAKSNKQIKPILDLFKPFEAQMEANNVSKDAYIKNMIVWEASLARDTVGTLKQIMQKFNVTPEQLGSRKKDDFLDDELTGGEEDVSNNQHESLVQEINALKTQVANQPMLAQVRQFEEATNAEGKLLHPHFAEVKPIMGQLIQQGKATTLQEAYKKAIKTLDVEEDAPDDADNAVDLDKIRQKVQKAKKASKGVKTKGGKTDFTSMSIKEELKARFKT